VLPALKSDADTQKRFGNSAEALDVALNGCMAGAFVVS
jgi:hypothetical protein